MKDTSGFRREISPAPVSESAESMTVESSKDGVDAGGNASDSRGGKPVGSWLIPLLTWIFRIVLGCTFLFSGIAKAIDPWGTVYKMHDYISAMPGGFMSWAVPLLTPGAFMLFSLETLTGVAIVTGSYRRIGAICSFLIMLVMSPLTLWIALENPVADCGCFGDAWVLTNWQTFWKNVVLTVMSVWLLIFNKRARCLIMPPLQWLMFIATETFSITVGFIGYSVQPMIDFRPYPVGGPLVEKSGVADGGNENLMAVWSDGKQSITIPADSIPEGDEWEFVDRVDVAEDDSHDGNTRHVTRGLAIFDGHEDITEDIISSEGGEQVVIFLTGLPELSSGNFYKLNSLYTYCKGHEIPMIAVAAATPLQIRDYIGHSLAEYPIYTAEDTAIKEVVRGNPAVVYLKDGRIVWKNSLSAIPTYDFMESVPDRDGALADYAPFADKQLFKTICLIFIGFIILLAILSHVPKVIGFTAERIRKSRWVKDGAVTKVSLSVVLLSSTLVSCGKEEPGTPPERTILIYMVATNSLAYDATDDLQEIMAGYGAIDNPKADILIYKAMPGNENPQLCKVTKQRNGTVSLTTLKTYPSSTSSLSQARIRQVISDMQSLAPAPDYGLILWSHATGWLPTGTPVSAPPVYRAFGDDYGKSISITDLAEALPQDTFGFIWMDCCLMGSVEVAYQLRNHCDTYVSYPTEILSGGAPYDKVIPHLAGEVFSLTEAAKATFEHYAYNPVLRYRSCTVSVTDTETLENIADVAREIVRVGNPLIPATGIQTYGKLKGASFYDFTQSFSSMTDGNVILDNAFVSAMRRAVVLKLATPAFLGITIDPSHFSGLSCHLLSDDVSASFSEYYKQLDWYRDVYGGN